MVNAISRLDTTDGGQLALFSDWTDRIKAGELPHETPPRPSGVERNIVVTVREWATPKHYLHDLAITDKRKPTVNAKGLIYGATELGSDDIPVIDPRTNKKWLIDAKVRDADTPSSLLGNPVVDPSPYWGSETIWNSRFNAHTPTLDETGKIYFAAQARAPKSAPAFCDKTSSLRSAQLYPLSARPEGFSGGQRQVTIYDPSTKQFSFIDTCFSSHHLNFAEDTNNTLWLNTLGSGDFAVVGWVNTKKFLETGDAASSQGWTPLIVDTNGNGKRDEGYNERSKPVDSAKDTRVPLNYYSISWSPSDGSVWGSSLAFPGHAVRLDPGKNPPESALAKSTRFRRLAMAFAARMSIATASSKRRSAAAT